MWGQKNDLPLNIFRRRIFHLIKSNICQPIRFEHSICRLYGLNLPLTLGERLFTRSIKGGGGGWLFTRAGSWNSLVEPLIFLFQKRDSPEHAILSHGPVRSPAVQNISVKTNLYFFPGIMLVIEITNGFANPTGTPRVHSSASVAESSEFLQVTSASVIFVPANFDCLFIHFRI